MSADNPVVFFDISIGGSLKGRVEMEVSERISSEVNSRTFGCRVVDLLSNV